MWIATLLLEIGGKVISSQNKWEGGGAQSREDNVVNSRQLSEVFLVIRQLGPRVTKVWMVRGPLLSRQCVRKKVSV